MVLVLYKEIKLIFKNSTNKESRCSATYVSFDGCLYAQKARLQFPFKYFIRNLLNDVFLDLNVRETESLGLCLQVSLNYEDPN